MQLRCLGIVVGFWFVVRLARFLGERKTLPTKQSANEMILKNNDFSGFERGSGRSFLEGSKISHDKSIKHL